MIKNNKGLKLLVIILSLLVIGLICFIFYDIVLSNNELKNNDINYTIENKVINGDYKILITNNTVEDEILNDVLDIIGIPYYNNRGNACLTDAISTNNYSANAKKIISFYIDSHNQFKLERPADNIYSSEECGIGAADCYVISKEKANKLFEIFNFEGNVTEYFQESTNLKDDYIFWYGHTLGFCDKKINHDIVAEYSSEEKKNEYGINIGRDIKIIDNQQVIKNIIDTNKKNEITERTITYIFKTKAYKTYYLDSVTVN